MGKSAVNDDSHDKLIMNCHAEANSINDNHGNWSIVMAQVVSVKPLFLTLLVGILLLGWSCGIVSSTITRRCWNRTLKRIRPASAEDSSAEKAATETVVRT